MEAFAIDDLFDFPNEEEEGDNAVFNGGLDGASETVTATPKPSADVKEEPFGGTLADVNLSSELCEPYDELAELEWVSNFMEESFSCEDFKKLQLITGTKSVSGSGSSSNSDSFSGSNSSWPETHTTQQPTKARTKRPRPPPNNWSSRLIVDSGSHLVNLNPVMKYPKPVKRKEPRSLLAPCDGRKCLHCATDKTPQWRTGPFGPKTLCNACGVRYKSGRLVPEYRPAASPTFVNSKHSNSHRKVMELRRKKEIMQNPFGNGDGLFTNHHMEPDFRKLI